MKSHRALVAALAAVGTLAAGAVIAEDVDLPEASGKQETLASCTGCHGIDLVTAQRRSPEEWSQVVSRMVGNGAALTDDQYQTVVAYLSQNLANTPPSTPAATN